ncbi:unnamed protein product, partial [Ectocarpus sp. 6 AP-2014]
AVLCGEINEDICARRNREFDYCPYFRSRAIQTKQARKRMVCFRETHFPPNPGRQSYSPKEPERLRPLIRQPNASLLGSAGRKVDTTVSHHHTTPSKKMLLPIDRIQRLAHEKRSFVPIETPTTEDHPRLTSDAKTAVRQHRIPLPAGLSP